MTNKGGGRSQPPFSTTRSGYAEPFNLALFTRVAPFNARLYRGLRLSMGKLVIPTTRQNPMLSHGVGYLAGVLYCRGRGWSTRVSLSRVLTTQNESEESTMSLGPRRVRCAVWHKPLSAQPTRLLGAGVRFRYRNEDLARLRIHEVMPYTMAVRLDGFLDDDG